MDLEIAREILRWVIIAVGINAGALLASAVLIVWLFVQMKRYDREIIREISNIDAMTREVLHRAE